MLQVDRNLVAATILLLHQTAIGVGGINRMRRMNMKRILALVLATMMLMSLTSGLAEVDYSVTEPINITFWHSISNDADIDLLTKIVKDFEASQDKITVTMEYIGGYNDINTNLVTVNAAGTGLPAVSIINVPRLANYVDGGLVEDLTPYIEANSYDLDDFGKGFIDGMNVNGVQAALPFMQSGQVFFYNKTATEANNLTFPTKWDEMEAYVKATFEATGKPAFTVLGADNAYFYCLFCNQGAFMINDDGLTTGLDSQATLDLILQLRDWKDKGYIDWLYTDAASTGRLNFTTGETMGLLYTTTLYNNYMAASEFEIGIALPPAGITQNHFVAGGTLIMPAKNDQATKNAAFQLMAWLAGPTYQLDWAMSTSYLPTRNSVQNDTEKYEKYLELLPEMRVVVENLDKMAKKTQHPLFDTCGDIFEKNLALIMVDGVAPTEGWQNMVTELNDYLGDQ